MQEQMVQPVPEKINFAEEEERILVLWTELDAFQESLKQSKSRPQYTFYDGPPFATGLPHYGHILAGTIKDVVTRFAHQSGFHVDRRFGWDCHGLPVEYEIDKMLNIKGPEDVAKMGIAEYNNQCRSIVMRYAKEWETTVVRLGRWIDFKNDYKTLYPSFMETVWWVFRQLFDKGFVYSGVKVMPYSTACTTPLSNFEANQNYKDVTDPAVIVSFPLLEDESVSLIAWTTTPWTLPSNLSVCVNPELIYVRVKDVATGSLYILMEVRLQALYKREDEYIVIDKFKGITLKDKRYRPLFDYFVKRAEPGAFRVLCDGYVTSESGTGVVHQAPYFGVDDFRVCLDNRVVLSDAVPICPVDATGCFTADVSDFAGQYVKDTDKAIMKMLKERGRLVHTSSFKHNYPFCWRSDTPLIYKAVPSWFVRVEHMVDKLVECNSQCLWVPEFVGDKRFANWLKGAHDWAISRNRYWGTPIPLWVSDDMKEVVCVGSIEELEALTGTKVTDLHRESVDNLTIPSRTGRGVLRRVSEVFDCWFESGSMPYAQVHYPFENRRQFEDSFPADFIAEGIDQTRGWFYTLLVLSTALFGKPPFRNVIVNGLVLASDGQKMSKRKKNYPDPVEVVNRYGADALRLYLINSPVVRAENLRFKEEGVRDVLKDVFLPWYNAYRFLVQNVDRLHREEGLAFLYNEQTAEPSDNIMDKWIISFAQSLIAFFKTEMAAYRLYTVVPRLVKFVDTLTNWYVRTNRRRLKGEGGARDCQRALETLFSVLFSMCRLMAPFTPFITELMYQNLRHLVDPASACEKDTRSIHYLMLPLTRETLIDERIEKAVARMQSVVELGRVVRDRKTLPVKYPLREVVVIHQDPQALEDIQLLQKYILEELNVRVLTTSTDKKRYGVILRAEPDHMVLGQRLKGAFRSVMTAIQKLDDAQLQEFQSKGSIVVEGHELRGEDLRLMYRFEQVAGASSQYETHSDSEVLILLDVTPDQVMLDEGVAREVINRIQKLRKKAHLVPSDEISVYYAVGPGGDYLAGVVERHREFVCTTIKAPLLPFPVRAGAERIIEESMQLKGSDLQLVLVRGSEGLLSAPCIGPACAYVNLQFVRGGTRDVGVALLENPRGVDPLDYAGLRRLAEHLTGVGGCRLFGGGAELSAEADLRKLSGGTVLVLAEGQAPTGQESPQVANEPACPYVNVQLLSNDNAGSARVATLLLRNPLGADAALAVPALVHQAAVLFSLRGRTLRLYVDAARTSELKDSADLLALGGKTLYLATS
ncbi:isoleucine--tRNA ligase, cytoplasmic isoform X1 [Lampetra planeri]